jgi:hypothetical protein
MKKAPQHRKGAHWDSDETAYLRKRVKEGATDLEIGIEMGTSANSVKNARQRYIATKRNSPWNKKKDKLLVEMRNNGHKWTDIAKHFGLTDNQCQGRYCRLQSGISQEEAPTPEETTPDEQQRVIDAQLRRAENAARMKDYRNAIAQKSPPPTWKPGNPVTW